MENNDFYSTAYYELPEGTPKEVSHEGGFFKHEAGIYKGFIGKLMGKYVNIEGSKIDSWIPGSRLSHFTLPIWLREYYHPKGNTVKILSDSLEIITQNPFETYFGIYVSAKPEDQWKYNGLFENLILPENKNFKIIGLNPKNPVQKITNFGMFPQFYGVPVKITLSLSDKGNVYASSITIIEEPRFDPAKIHELEASLKTIIELRKNRNQEQSPMPEAEDFDFNVLDKVPSRAKPAPENKKSDQVDMGDFGLE
jgi:hypothetical protein